MKRNDKRIKVEWSYFKEFLRLQQYFILHKPDAPLADAEFLIRRKMFKMYI